MTEAEPDESSARLKSGETDLALVYDHETTTGLLPPELALARLVDDRYDVILQKGHPLAERRRLKLADLADEPWVASSSTVGCRRITDGVCREAGFDPKVAFEVDETLAAQALVAAGVGVTLLPRLALATVHPGVVARALSDAPVRTIWAARLEDAYRSPASEAMLQILQDVAEEFRDAPLVLVS